MADEAPGVIRLMFNLGNGRTQNVLVSGKQAGAFEYFVIWTPICRESQISAREAMVRNATMSIGALGLVPDGTVILRWSARPWPPDGRVFPCYTVSQVLAPCRPWQRPPRPAG